MAEVEQGASASQDPGQPAAPAAPAQPEFTGGGPWDADIRASFDDPQTQQRVHELLRTKVQPHVTQVEQRAAEAQQLYQAFEDDPYAAYQAIGAQLYGNEQQAPAPAPGPAAPTPQYLYDQWGNAYDGQTGQLVQPVQPQQQAPPAAYQPQAPPQQQAPQPGDPRFDEVYSDYQERAYDRAKQEFLGDPANRDINPQLFDQFTQSAETWEEAAAAYRSYAAAWAASQEAPPPDTAPPQMGSEGDASSTPVEQRKSLNDTIDEIWGEATTPAPPM